MRTKGLLLTRLVRPFSSFPRGRSGLTIDGRKMNMFFWIPDEEKMTVEDAVLRRHRLLPDSFLVRA